MSRVISSKEPMFHLHHVMGIWQNRQFYLLQMVDGTFKNFEAPHLNTAIKVL